MALKVKDELVGKRFICFEKSTKDLLRTCCESNNFENIVLKQGVIRATTSKDVNEDSHQILVEYDNQPWEKREWLTTADQTCLLLVEESLSWMPKDVDQKSKLINNNNNTTDHLPVLIFKKFYEDLEIKENIFVVEILQGKKLLFQVDQTTLVPFKEEDLTMRPAMCDDPRTMTEVGRWWDLQNGQNILLNMPLVLVGFRVQVYRTEGTTQWFTAVIRMVDENSQMLIILDDTVLEEHHVSPCLVQMSLLGEGVVTSLLKGNHVKIRPSRTRTTTISKNLTNNLERKRKKSVVKDHPKKRKTRSPQPIDSCETNNINSEEVTKPIRKTPSNHPPSTPDARHELNLNNSNGQPRIVDNKPCNKSDDRDRSLFRPLPIKQKKLSPSSSSSSSSFSSSSSSSSFSSSSSSSSSDSSEGNSHKSNEKVWNVNKNNHSPEKESKHASRLPASTKSLSSSTSLSSSSREKLTSVTNLTSNDQGSKSSIKLNKNKKTREKKGVIFLPEEGEETIHNSSSIIHNSSSALPHKLSQEKRSATDERNSNMETFDRKNFMLSGKSVGTSEHQDKPVDLSASTVDAKGRTSQSVSEHFLPAKPVQTVFPTVNCPDRSNKFPGNGSAPPSDGSNRPSAHNTVDRSAKNMIPLSYIPFFLNANASDLHKFVNPNSFSGEQVASIADNLRFIQQLQSNDVHPKTLRKVISEHQEQDREEQPTLSRDVRNQRADRRESKFIVHEPQRPGDAVNHHFSKSLKVRHPVVSQPTFVPGVVLPPHSGPIESPHHNMTLNPRSRPAISPKGWATRKLNSDQNSICSALKPSPCTSGLSLLNSNSSVDSLKPTLDLSGNVYLPNVSMVNANREALLRLQQDQLHDYLRMKAQLHHVQHQATPQNQTKQTTNKDVVEIPTSSFLLLSNKLVASPNVGNNSYLPKAELVSGVLDLQKKQQFPLATSTSSKSSHQTVQFWPDKVPVQDHQSLLSNSIILLDYQGIKGIDQSLVNRLALTNSSNPRGGVINSGQGEESLVAQGKKRIAEDGLPFMNGKKMRVADKLMDVTSLLFCGSERQVTSPQLGFLPQSLTSNHYLQNCFQVATPDVPSFLSFKEGNMIASAFAEGGSMSRVLLKQEEAGRPTRLPSTGDVIAESLRNIVSSTKLDQTKSSSNFVDSQTSKRYSEVATDESKLQESFTEHLNLPIIISDTSMKCMSSPESSRDNAIGTDSETRSACSPLLIRSVGGTPTFAASSEINDSSLAVRSSSVCSSVAPVKFKKAWLKRYDEDSRNDSPPENISSEGHIKYSDVDGDVAKSEGNLSKSFDISHQDVMTPSTSAVEDSNEAWMSENEVDENKSVASHRSGADFIESKVKESKVDFEERSFECIGKMKGRLRELRVVSRRDDPSAILSSQVLNHMSKEKRSETMESFLQDGSCHEVTPRLIKCRECRAIKNKKDRKAPNDFCRFYAFRRLRYISKRHLSVSGFSDLNDVKVPDMELWFPTLPIIGPLLNQQVASYLLAHLHESFSKIVEVEKTAEAWCRKTISNESGNLTTAWKRAVQGVKEMCDVCDAALFNIHCVCNKCGFAVCISCHKEKVFQMRKMKTMSTGNNSSGEKVDHFNFSDDSSSRSEKNKRSKNDKQNDPIEEPSDKWLTCHNKQQLHDPHKLMVAQTIPSDVLWYLKDLLDKYLKTQTPPGASPSSLPFLSLAFDRLAVLADVAERQIQQDEKQFENKNRPPPIVQQLPHNSPFVGTRKLQTMTNNRDSDSQGLTGNGTKFQGKCMTMLQKERLLHITDASSSMSDLFLSNFQEHWSKGLPVVASKCNLDIDLWRPDLLYRTLSRSDPNHLESFVDAVACRRFWEGFEKVSARVKQNQHGLSTPDPMLSPIFTWGSSKDEFRDTLPNQFQNLMESLPIHPYTSDLGHFNLSSRLPDFFAKPDLGPHLLVGYGQLDMFEGSLPLKLEGCDVITLLASVVTPKDDVTNHLSAAEKYLLKIGCGLKLSDTATKPGVVWHVFERQHNDVIEKIIVEKQMKAVQSSGLLSKPPVYLNVDDLKILKREQNIEPITVVQHLDDAVFVPARCYHQARFLYGCVMASMDVVTPENVDFMLNHQLKAGFNCSDKLQLLNTIYHATKDSLAITMQSEMLSHCH